MILEIWCCILSLVVLVLNYWGMRASAGLMRMYELQNLVVAAADDLRDASALHVHTPGSHAQILELFSLSLPV